ncbi:DUF664 domain-containing protein [Nocardia sp. NPDC052254]|uniref:mycothiol transferase n=1 Tax=Nocardia sp. NPDC052254 TaxID=3155681 RepID=UPI0034199EB6
MSASERARRMLSMIDRSHPPHHADEKTTLTGFLRWIRCHLIEEYARHNGHADLIRERIDGSTGE